MKNFDRSQQKTTVRDKMVENGMRGCYGRRNNNLIVMKCDYEWSGTILHG